MLHLSRGVGVAGGLIAATGLIVVLAFFLLSRDPGMEESNPKSQVQSTSAPPTSAPRIPTEHAESAAAPLGQLDNDTTAEVAVGEAAREQLSILLDPTDLRAQFVRPDYTFQVVGALRPDSSLSGALMPVGLDSVLIPSPSEDAWWSLRTQSVEVAHGALPSGMHELRLRLADLPGLEGVIVDSERTPVAYATVELVGVFIGKSGALKALRAESDVDGRFTFAGLPASAVYYRYRITKSGYLPLRGDGLLLSKPHIESLASLVLESASDLVVTALREDGTPISGCVVAVQQAKEDPQTYVTDDKGTCQTTGLRGGPVGIWLECAECVRSREEVPAWRGLQSVTLVCGRGLFVHGTAQFDDGVPCEGLVISGSSLEEENGGSLRSITALIDAAGGFKLGPFKEGMIELHTLGRTAWSGTFHTSDSIDITIPRPLRTNLLIELRDAADGAVVANASGSYGVKIGNTVLGPEALRADANGQVSISVSMPSTPPTGLLIAVDHYVPVEVENVLKAYEESGVVRLRLTKCTSIRGRVTSRQDGRAVEGADVLILQAPPPGINRTFVLPSGIAWADQRPSAVGVLGSHVRTNQSGEFEAPTLGSALLSCEVSAVGFRPVITAPQSPTTLWEIALEPD